MMMIWKRTDVSVRCMCGDTLSTALWRRPVSPVVPYRNETRYDVALPDEAISIKQIHSLIDRASSTSNLALRVVRLDEAANNWEYQIMAPHRGFCCSAHWICYDRPGLSKKLSSSLCRAVPIVTVTASGLSFNLVFSLYEGNDVYDRNPLIGTESRGVPSNLQLLWLLED
jgi:hypothetical protein